MDRHFVILFFVVALVLSAVAPAYAGDFVFVRVKNTPVRVPSCPAGCEVRLYQIPARFVGGGRCKRDWHGLIDPTGMFFPKGGFVMYQPITGVCLIASTANDLDVFSSRR